MRSEKQIKETVELLDRVMRDGPAQAINWLRGAFFTHEENIHSLREDIKDLRSLALSYINGPLTVKQAQLLGVCRVCRKEPGAPFILNYGEEYAHPKCLEKDKQRAKDFPRFPTLTVMYSPSVHEEP